MLIDDRAVDMLFFGEDIRDMLFFGEDIRNMLFFGEDTCDIDLFRASISALRFVCERALFGIAGASSPEPLRLDAVPK